LAGTEVLAAALALQERAVVEPVLRPIPLLALAPVSICNFSQLYRNEQTLKSAQ
jgi:hypothetical protein